jgi:hypothetical protein
MNQIVSINNKGKRETSSIDSFFFLEYKISPQKVSFNDKNINNNKLQRNKIKMINRLLFKKKNFIFQFS